MAYDEGLAVRVRDLLSDIGPMVTEKQMFGGGDLGRCLRGSTRVEWLAGFEQGFEAGQAWTRR
ncbi:hypothetical protein [Pseudofrankia inefficax]|uniref:Uncharacterized protein n=1 Tax=Pseudofrankia inefficax (strain DSM 45817 / CECT 9037 / DDB 130130 / EuI1c) TaxID=298654 RepID=E3IWA5_PSEI1|nr:hypothetical protein [Pseudofrankia inefficax]ADP78947.1 hypothetical protein FraEuI1c_0869 [Pseudofrankia inefficax]